MSQTVNSSSVKIEDSTRHAESSESPSVAYATNEDTKSKVLRTQREINPAEELRRKVMAAYTDAELAQKLGKDFIVVTRAANGNPDIIEFSVDALGLDTQTRPIDRKHVEEDLMPSDESTWDPLEVCFFWPEYAPNLDPLILMRIISGNHRVTAADEPIKALQMRVYKVETEREFRILAIRSNVSHGLNFTEDQRKTQAIFLRQGGDSISAIAAIINVNKSTVSRWFSGKDSNASRRTERTTAAEQERKPMLDAPSVVQSGIDPAQQKVMGLLMDAKMAGDTAPAQMYIRALKPEQQKSLRALSAWLQEVMEG